MGKQIKASGVPVRCSFTRIVPAASLKPTPDNPNRHPKKQLVALGKIINHQGWRRAPVVSNQSGFIVTGHGAVQAAILAGWKDIPIDEQNFSSPEDERAHLLADNKISEWANLDTDLARQLVADLDELEFDIELTGFDKDFIDLTPEKIDHVDDELVMPGDLKAFDIVDNMAFASDEKFEIPLLRKELLASCPEPINVWCGRDYSEPSKHYLYNSNSDSIRGLDLTKTVLAFYVDDYRWENQVWSTKPSEFAKKLINSKFMAVFAPNFSLWTDMAQALRIYNVFRSRWCGRYWQECGVKIIPDVQYPSPADYDFVFAGIPKKSPCVGTQWQTNGTKTGTRDKFIPVKQKGFLQMLKVLDPQSVLIYANDLGREAVEEVLPKSLHVVWCATRSRTRGQKIDDGKKGGEKVNG